MSFFYFSSLVFSDGDRCTLYLRRKPVGGRRGEEKKKKCVCESGLCVRQNSVVRMRRPSCPLDNVDEDDDRTEKSVVSSARLFAAVVFAVREDEPKSRRETSIPSLPPPPPPPCRALRSRSARGARLIPPLPPRPSRSLLLSLEVGSQTEGEGSQFTALQLASPPVRKK